MKLTEGWGEPKNCSRGDSRGFKMVMAGLEPGRAIAPIPHRYRNCPLKILPRGHFFKIWGKTQKEAHKKRYNVQFSTKITS